MLELRPTCEHCNRPLPPETLEARICTYECTFCAPCVDDLLGNVCPNCGGFVPRPIRPQHELEERQLPRQRSSEHHGEYPDIATACYLNTGIRGYHFIFWPETLAVVAFAAAWLVKGQAILKDPGFEGGELMGSA
jgi:hypothetical protein